MITITRQFQFCCGHRVFQHESKCAHPHGHNYLLLATFQGELDALGRIMDFSVVKNRLGKWIDDNWDHGFVLFKDDFAIEKWMIESKSKFFILPYNPTAENMAKYVMHEVIPDLFPEIVCTKIRLWETPNCFAEVTNEDRSF